MRSRSNMFAEEIIGQAKKELEAGKLDHALTIIQKALSQDPGSLALLQTEAEIYKLQNIFLDFLKPDSIYFKDIKNCLNTVKNVRHSPANCSYTLNQRFEYSHNLELFHMKDAYITQSYGVHGKNGSPYWGTVLTRGNPSENLTYPRGYPTRSLESKHPDIFLDEGFYINYLQMRNFGHFLTETASSIYPLLDWVNDKRLSSIPILINEKYSSQDFQINGLIELLGITIDQIIIIGKDVKVAQIQNLFMSKPTHINRSFVSHHHASIVRKMILRKLNCSEKKLQKQMHLTPQIKKLYISRSQLNPSLRKFTQEQELERRLETLGWTIFHPQHHDLLTQITTYESSSYMCGPEGSAIHMLYGTHHIQLKKFILLCRNNTNNFTRQLLSQNIISETIECFEKTQALRKSGQSSPNYDVQIKSGFSVKELAEQINDSSKTI